MLALYAAYGARVARTRRGVPCGCAGERTPMTGWVAGRAAAFAALALAGALWGLPGDPTRYEIVTIVAAGLGFAVILWTLPLAMTEERSPAV
ncbi:MauE/DoxX family redox-associated membrane protein [Actinomadura fibrosa]|uniref:MauE/DoxX family redox-associated membrane protein n=1 Tax=Actinomadura fibrosa TaxID=111802 RepID=UPI001041B660